MGIINEQGISQNLHKIVDTFRFSDERTRGWLLVDSPKPTLIYTMFYLLIVWAGPKVMKKRKAFKLTWALVPYNLAMACLNAYIAIQVNITSYDGKWSMMEKYHGTYLPLFFLFISMQSLSLESGFPLLIYHLSIFFAVIRSFHKVTI